MSRSKKVVKETIFCYNIPMRFPSFKNKIVGILLIVAFIFPLNVFQKQIKGFFYSASLPFQSFLWGKGSGVSDFFSSMFSGNALKQENNQLKEKTFALEAKVIELENISKENGQLRQAFDLGIQKDFQIIPAHIIGKNIGEDVITIDKGANDGLQKDMPVITPGKVLAGKIVEVFDGVSKVMLIWDEKSAFDAAVQNKQITGLLKGKGKFLATLDLIDKDKNPVEGDMVVTTRLGNMFPANLLVGTVKSIKKNDLVSFQSAEVLPLFDINASSILFVIK